MKWMFIAGWDYMLDTWKGKVECITCLFAILQIVASSSNLIFIWSYHCHIIVLRGLSFERVNGMKIKIKKARKRKWNCKFCFRRRVYWGKLEAGSGESQHNHAFEHTHDFFYNIKTNWNLSYLILLQVFIALVVFWKYIKYYEVVNLTKKGEKYN